MADTLVENRRKITRTHEGYVADIPGHRNEDVTCPQGELGSRRSYIRCDERAAVHDEAAVLDVCDLDDRYAALGPVIALEREPGTDRSDLTEFDNFILT